MTQILVEQCIEQCIITLYPNVLMKIIGLCHFANVSSLPDVEQVAIVVCSVLRHDEAATTSRSKNPWIAESMTSEVRYRKDFSRISRVEHTTEHAAAASDAGRYALGYAGDTRGTHTRDQDICWGECSGIRRGVCFGARLGARWGTLGGKLGVSLGYTLG